MGKRLTVLATALLLVWSMTAAAFAKEPEISVEIDQIGQDSAAAVITLGSEVYTSILVKVPGEPWYDFTWVLEDAKSMTLPVYENGTVQVQATRENGTKATASATVDCLPEPEPLDCPVEAEPEKEPEPQPTPQKQPTATPPVTTVPRPEETQDKPKDEATPETGTESKTETPEPGTGFTSEGNAVTRDLLYDKATNKQFVTLETKDGAVFYLVIDYDSPVNEEEEQYQTYFLNLVDAADLAALVGEEKAEPEEGAPPLCSCRERCQVGKIDTTCPVCTTEVTLSCGGARFTAKGTFTTQPGWRTYQPSEEKALPQLTQGQELTVDHAEVKEGVTKPPAHYTEASLLAAMEQAGRDEQPKETQRRGIGTAATRAGILERLVNQGFVQRVKGKDGQAATLIPAQSGSALAAILPEPLRSPQLTAQWEWSLQKIEDGLLEPEAFLSEVQEMVTGLVSGFTPVEDAEYLFPSNRPVVGTCPRCGREVTESPNGFFCENPRCRFALWRDNRFFTNKQFALTKEKAQALLQHGEVFAEHLYSEKTGSYYDATIVLDTSAPVPRYFLKYGQ